MKGVELYAQVRFSVQIEGISRLGDRLRGHQETIGERLMQDLEDWLSACHGAHCEEGPVLAMLALLRVAPLLPSPTLRAVPGVMPGRDGKAGSPIEQES